MVQKITNWYTNHKTVPVGEGSTLISVGTHWNYRLVIQHLYKEDISARASKSGLIPRDPGWIKQYQLSVNEVIEKLGGEDQMAEKYGEVAKTWNVAALPEELKRK